MTVKPHATVVIDTYGDEREAIKDMHRYATNLRGIRNVKRYGVFVEKQADTWYLCLVDRYT